MPNITTNHAITYTNPFNPKLPVSTCEDSHAPMYYLWQHQIKDCTNFNISLVQGLIEIFQTADESSLEHHSAKTPMKILSRHVYPPALFLVVKFYDPKNFP